MKKKTKEVTPVPSVGHKTLQIVTRYAKGKQSLKRTAVELREIGVIEPKSWGYSMIVRALIEMLNKK